MREMSVSAKTVPSARIHISNSKQSSPQYLYKAQPPRPPCWQDFIGKSIHSTSPKSSSKIDSHVNISLSSGTDTDKKKQAKSSSSANGQKSKTKKSSSGSLKASRGISSFMQSSQTKLKRTRSEPCIAEKEIPEDALQVRLTSHQLSKQSMDEAKRYLEDAYHKCSHWLSQISPAPLEDTDFEVGSGDIITCSDETAPPKDLVEEYSKRHSLALDKIPE